MEMEEARAVLGKERTQNMKDDVKSAAARPHRPMLQSRLSNISNHNSQELKTPVTHTKQTTAPGSNRNCQRGKAAQRRIRPATGGREPNTSLLIDRRHRDWRAQSFAPTANYHSPVTNLENYSELLIRMPKKER